MEKNLPTQVQDLNLYSLYLKEAYNKGEILVVQLAFTLDEALYSAYQQLEKEGKHSENFTLNAWIGIPFKAIENDAYSDRRTVRKTKGTMVEAPRDNSFFEKFSEMIKEGVAKERLAPETKRKNALMKRIIKEGDVKLLEKYAKQFSESELAYLRTELKDKK